MNLQGTKQETSKLEKMKIFTATEARAKFSDVFNQAHYGDGVLVEKQGKKVAVIPIDVLQRLAELEELIDNLNAKDSLGEFQQMGGTTLDDLEKELLNE